jgi:DNA (cytosine-5)-methyltransferase 1
MADRPNLSWHLRAERLAAEGSKTVLSAGFPCQDVSYAGEGAGLAGARSGLVWPLLRAIRLVRPRRAVLENVAALLSRGLDQILGRMAAFGYDAEWHCIPASAVGAPHQRDRIWIIATDAGSQQHEGGSAPISGALSAELSGTATDAAAMHKAQIIGHEPNGNHPRSAKVADTTRQHVNGTGKTGAPGGREHSDGGWWSVEPAVDRMADGVPSRVDRLRCLGTAVGPQVAEWIGARIMQAMEAAA